jgi:hypothetical protein
VGGPSPAQQQATKTKYKILRQVQKDKSCWNLIRAD